MSTYYESAVVVVDGRERRVGLLSLWPVPQDGDLLIGEISYPCKAVYGVNVEREWQVLEQGPGSQVWELAGVSE